MVYMRLNWWRLVNLCVYFLAGWDKDLLWGCRSKTHRKGAGWWNWVHSERKHYFTGYEKRSGYQCGDHLWYVFISPYETMLNKNNLSFLKNTHTQYLFVLSDGLTTLYKKYTINTRSTQPTVREPTATTILTTSLSVDSFTRPTALRPTSLLPGNNNGIVSTRADSFTHPATPRPTSILPGNNNGISATSVSPLQCTIAPLSGTIIDAFNITCNTAFICPNCQYCFKTLQGKFHSFGGSGIRGLVHQTWSSWWLLVPHKTFFYYYMKPSGNHLQCSNNKEVISVFLPPGNKHLNYNLRIIATAKDGSFVAMTIITARVCKRIVGLTEPFSYLNWHITIVTVHQSSGTRLLHGLELFRWWACQAYCG